MLTRLLKDRRGSAAVEFAFIIPIILIFYYGMVEGSGALLANRRAAHVATAIGDIVAQNGPTTTAGVNDVFNIADAIFKPLTTTKLAIRITSIRIETDGKQTVLWSQTKGAITPLSGTVNDVPVAMRVAGAGVIKSETVYTYVSPLKRLMPNDIKIEHVTHMRPRTYVPVLRTN